MYVYKLLTLTLFIFKISRKQSYKQVVALDFPKILPLDMTVNLFVDIINAKHSDVITMSGFLRRDVAALAL